MTETVEKRVESLLKQTADRDAEGVWQVVQESFVGSISSEKHIGFYKGNIRDIANYVAELRLGAGDLYLRVVEPVHITHRSVAKLRGMKADEEDLETEKDRIFRELETIRETLRGKLVV